MLKEIIEVEEIPKANILRRQQVEKKEKVNRKKCRTQTNEETLNI